MKTIIRKGYSKQGFKTKQYFKIINDMLLITKYLLTERTDVNFVIESGYTPLKYHKDKLISVQVFAIRITTLKSVINELNILTMKNTLKYLSVGLLLSGFGLWLIETLFFILVHGWHMTAINEHEQFLDELSGTVISMGLFISFVYIILTVKVINLIKE